MYINPQDGFYSHFDANSLKLPYVLRIIFNRLFIKNNSDIAPMRHKFTDASRSAHMNIKFYIF